MTEPQREGAEVLARDLRNCTDASRLLVAEWMLAHGWTEPLDDEGTTTAHLTEVPGYYCDACPHAMYLHTPSGACAGGCHA